jgi:hypothetical protein
VQAADCGQPPPLNNGFPNPEDPMAQDTPRDPSEHDKPLREDEPLPAASEDRVLEETARLAREGRKELESDPKENRQPD